MAHVFGERTLSTLERLLGLLSAFEVVVWMTDGWPLYESRLKGELHVISKRYTQRIERHNLNLRQHLARLGRKSLSFSKSVELHDKVIGPEGIPAAADIVNLRYKSCPEMEGQDQGICTLWGDDTEFRYQTSQSVICCCFLFDKTLSDTV